MIDRKWPLYFEIIDSWSSPFHAYREKICKPVRTVKKKKFNYSYEIKKYFLRWNHRTENILALITKTPKLPSLHRQNCFFHSCDKGISCSWGSTETIPN